MQSEIARKGRLSAASLNSNVDAVVYGKENLEPKLNHTPNSNQKGMTMKYVSTMLALLSITALSACSSVIIGEKEGSDYVSLANANQVANCQSKGKINVSVMAKIGIIPRTEEDVEANLFQMARNNAVENGADTLVKGESKELGKRTFEMFKCRP